MDKPQDLMSWFKRMGYDGKMPESFDNIYNHSTSIIWDQLIQNTKPKQEVDNLRNNLIIHRLRSNALNKQDEYPYSLKEIELYIKRRFLENKLNNLQSSINEKRHRLNNLSQNNKMKYITKERLKSRAKENEEREYLLKKKCKILGTNIQEAKETLNCAKNLTPVELDENPNTKEITETLQKCADKLEELLEKNPQSSKTNTATTSMKPFYSAQKQPKTQSTFEKYLIMSEKKLSTTLTVRHTHRSMAISNRNKENINSVKKVNVNLFNSEPNGKKKNRESLGILHESHVNEENFLVMEESINDVFSSPLTLLGGNEKRANVPSINVTTQHLELTTQHLDANVSSYNHTNLQHLSLQMQGQNLNQRRLNFEVMYNNEFVINQLKTLLYNHNRQIIWNTMQILNDNLNSEITKNVTFKCEQNVRNKNINQDDVARLQFLHIQTELQILKLKAVSKDLSNKINKRKKQICEAINKRVVSLDRANCIERSFVEQLEDVGLDAVLIQMKKEINSAKKIEDSTELQITLGKTAQVKSDITQKVATIKHYVNNIYETLQSTMSTREQTVACVRKLGPFVEDLTWSLPLTKDLCSSEAKTFEKFPLEYNRRCVYTDPRIYYRDIITDNIPTDVELDSDSTFMLTTILESPYSPPETVLLNILKSKMKLDALKSIGNCTANIIHNSLKELQAQESYVQYALDRLNSILYSTSSNKTLATADLMKRVIQIWMQMPLKGLISSKRKVEGKDYNYYEKQYDSFYNNI